MMLKFEIRQKLLISVYKIYNSIIQVFFWSNFYQRLGIGILVLLGKCHNFTLFNLHLVNENFTIRDFYLS